MTSERDNSIENSARLRAAGDWLIRLEEDDLPEAEVFRWIEWCEADSRNLAAFESLQPLWHEARAFSFLRRPASRRRRVPMRLAVAASIAILAVAAGWLASAFWRERGARIAEVEVVKDAALFEGVWQKGSRYPVWMSHGDRVTRLPDGFEVIGVSNNAPFAAIADEKRKFYAVQFHPERLFTRYAAHLEVFRTFVRACARPHRVS